MSILRLAVLIGLALASGIVADAQTIPATPATVTTATGRTGVTGSTGRSALLPSMRWYLMLGDSRTAPNPGHNGSDRHWGPTLTTSLTGARGGAWEFYNCGKGSETTATYAAGINTRLAAALDSTYGISALLPGGNTAPSAVLLNVGINDSIIGPMPDQSTWQANMLIIIDAVRTRWVTAPIYIMRWWGRGFETDADTEAAWITTFLSQRSWLYLGPDERVFYKGSDNGATNTYDGIHQNGVGMDATAAAWKAVLVP